MRRPTCPAATQSARGLADPAARALAEWIAIRTAPRTVGYPRIIRFLTAYPNWPSAPTIRRRAEEALFYDRVDGETVRAFFSNQKPLTDEGKIALAGALLQTGDRKGATALIRDAYRNDELSKDARSDDPEDLSGPCSARPIYAIAPTGWSTT